VRRGGWARGRGSGGGPRAGVQEVRHRSPGSALVGGHQRDHKDTAQDLARELADIAGQLASLKGEADSWLRDPNYDTLKHRLENAPAAVEAVAVEARRRVRLNEGR